MTNTYGDTFTAIVTPFLKDGGHMDFEGLRSFCEFQIKCGISGIAKVGTTGESPTLTWDEHIKVFQTTFDAVDTRTTVIASTTECQGTEHARDMGIKHVLLVDPYYKGRTRVSEYTKQNESTTRSRPTALPSPSRRLWLDWQ